MADRQFIYRVDIDTASAKKAADATRAMFAQSISGKGTTKNVADLKTYEQIRKFGLMQIEAEKMYRAEVRKTGLTQLDAKKTYEAEIRKAHAVAMRNMRTEANEMNRVFNQRRRQQELQQRQGALGLARGIMTGDVGAILGGGVVGFAAMQAGRMLQNTIRTIGEMGTEGAGIARITRSFDELAESIGLNADLLAGKMRNAMQGTVSDYELMASANLLLVTAQQGGVKVTEEQIASLARLARSRSTQLTLAGKNLTATEAFDRLIRGISKRESELLDELGISSKQLAAVTGKSLQEISGSVQGMMDAVLQVAEADFAKFGDPLIDAAGRIEQANARVVNSMNELRQELAEPVADVKVNLAGYVEGFNDAAVAVLQWNEAVENATGSVQRQVREIQRAGAAGTDNIAINATVAAIEELDIARAKGEIGFIGYWRAIGDVIQRFDELQNSLYGVLPGMQEMNQTIAVLLGMTGGGGGLTRADFPGTPGATATALRQEATAKERVQAVIAGEIASAELTEAERKYRMAIGDNAERVRILQAAVDAAKVGTDEWVDAMFALAGAQLDLAGDIEAVKGKFLDLQGDIDQYQLSLRLGAAASDIERVAILRDLGLSDTTPEGRKNELEIAKLERSIADDAAREWKRAAKESEAAWKAAAKEAERAFKDALSKIPGIPGVTGKTEVTQEQLDQAAAGIPQNFVDNFTRRMNDELINGVDYQEVSRGFVEELVIASSGIAPEIVKGLSNEMLAARATEEISTGRVFGVPFGQENFPTLIDVEVAKQIEAQNLQAEAGGAFVTERFRQAGIGLGGVSAAGAAAVGAGPPPVDTGAAEMAEGLDTDIQAQIKDKKIGESLAQTIGTGFSGAFTPGNEGYVDVAGPTLANWNAQFGTEDIVKGLKSIGKAAALNFFSGFTNGVTESAWGAMIIAAIKGDITKSLTDMAVAN